MLTDTPTYDPVAVQPLRDELLQVGFQDLYSPGDVDQAINAQGTTLLVLNSVCGCSAGAARPGVSAALQSTKIPDRMVALFAGQEKAAVAHLRTKYFGQSAPSSPNVALFQDGKLVMHMERHHIQQMDAQSIADVLAAEFQKICTKEGPSIPQEKYENLAYVVSCGSTMPRLDGKKGSC